MKQVATIFFVFFVLNVFGQSGSKIGKQSPELSFSNIINYGKPSAKLTDFKSKVVILDFWATWCAPCIKSFPHLEELQDKFKADLQIITITDDSEGRIEKFLSKQELNLPIVFDTKKEIASHFPHQTIPHAVIIDKNGIVRAITTSAELTEDLIKQVINNKPIMVEEKREAMSFDPSKPLSGNENLLYQVTITPYQEGLPSMASPNGGTGIYSNRRIIATNLSPRLLYEVAYQFPAETKLFIEVEDMAKFKWEKQNLICFELIVPEEMGDQRFEIMQNYLSLLFPYDATVEQRLRPVKVLKPVNGAKINISPSEKTSESTKRHGGSGLSMKNSKMETLAIFLEERLNKPIIDETGLTGNYDLEMPWYNEDHEQIYSELKKIGLELVDDERKIDVLVISDK